MEDYGEYAMEMDSDYESPPPSATKDVAVVPEPAVPMDTNPDSLASNIDTRLGDLVGDTLCYQLPHFSLEECARTIIDTVDKVEQIKKNDFFQEGNAVDVVEGPCTDANRKAWAKNAEVAYKHRKLNKEQLVGPVEEKKNVGENAQFRNTQKSNERKRKKRDEAWDKELNTIDPPDEQILRMTRNILKNCTVVPSDHDLAQSQRGSKGRSFTEDSGKWLRPDVDSVKPEPSSSSVPLKDLIKESEKEGVYWNTPPPECDNQVVIEYMRIKGYRYIVTSLENNLLITDLNGKIIFVKFGQPTAEWYRVMLRHFQKALDKARLIALDDNDLPPVKKVVTPTPEDTAGPAFATRRATRAATAEAAAAAAGVLTASPAPNVNPPVPNVNPAPGGNPQPAGRSGSHSGAQSQARNSVNIMEGVSYGGGQRIPGKFKRQDSKADEAVKSLLRNPHYWSWLQYCTRRLQSVFYPHFAVMREINIILAIHHQLVTEHVLCGIPWSATSYNTGPQAESIGHNDARNFLYNLCLVGVFAEEMNHQKYGHFIINDLKTIIEFKHGDIVVFPSALLKHENSPLADYVYRRSVVCYMAGGLPRWIAQGHAGDSKSMEAEKDRLAEERRELGYGLYPTFKNLWDAVDDGKLFLGTAKPLMESLKHPVKAAIYDKGYVSTLTQRRYYLFLDGKNKNRTEVEG